MCSFDSVVVTWSDDKKYGTKKEEGHWSKQLFPVQERMRVGCTTDFLLHRIPTCLGYVDAYTMHWLALTTHYTLHTTHFTAPKCIKNVVSCSSRWRHLHSVFGVWLPVLFQKPWNVNLYAWSLFPVLKGDGYLIPGCFKQAQKITSLMCNDFIVLIVIKNN